MEVTQRLICQVIIDLKGLSWIYALIFEGLSTELFGTYILNVARQYLISCQILNVKYQWLKVRYYDTKSPSQNL